MLPVRELGPQRAQHCQQLLGRFRYLWGFSGFQIYNYSSNMCASRATSTSASAKSCEFSVPSATTDKIASSADAHAVSEALLLQLRQTPTTAAQSPIRLDSGMALCPRCGKLLSRGRTFERHASACAASNDQKVKTALKLQVPLKCQRCKARFSVEHSSSADTEMKSWDKCVACPECGSDQLQIVCL